MFLQSKTFRALCIFCLVLSLSILTFGDTIRLKDGGIIKGKIVSFDGGKFIVVISEGNQRERRMSFLADEIASIEFDSQVSPAAAVSNTPDASSDSRKPEIRKVGNTTIITPRQRDYEDNSASDFPQNTSPVVKTTDNTSTNIPANNTSTNIPVKNTTNTNKPQPISIPVKVLADNTANGWTNSGWVVKKGQRIRIIGKGRISLGSGRYSDARGISSLPDSGKLLKDDPTGGLLAVVGDDNNDFIFIGDDNEFVATRDGTLFLGVNEGNLNDNSGSFDVVIEIDPMSMN